LTFFFFSVSGILNIVSAEEVTKTRYGTIISNEDCELIFNGKKILSDVCLSNAKNNVIETYKLNSSDVVLLRTYP
jgi:hypothetical protein